MTGVSLSKALRQGRPTLRVDWIAPQSDVTISEYHVQYRRSGTFSWGTQATTAPTLTSTTLTALNASTELDVRVRARSAVGNGEWSEMQTERTYSSEHNIYS